MFSCRETHNLGRLVKMLLNNINISFVSKLFAPPERILAAVVTETIKREMLE
jgi:hypothetical protein